MSATTGLGGVSTGVGSLPGTDPLAAATWVLDEAPDLPHLAELPERGIGADAVGRSAAMLVDLPVEVVHSGWQVSARPGTDLARARRLLGDDLAALEVAAHGYRGPMKVQVLGPVTLACVLGQARGEAALSDPGLRRELAQSLAEGVRRHLGDLTARVPGAVPVLQVDEPALPAALAGAQPTRSGWGRLAPLDQGWAEQMLGEVLAACPDRESRIVHCCARDVPVALVVSAGELKMQLR